MATSSELSVFDSNNTSVDPMQMLQLAAMNINGLSQQMGLVNARLDVQSQDIDRIKMDIDGIKSSQTITRAQQRSIKRAVMCRVNEVLKIQFDGGKVADDCIDVDVAYRGGFISRCYTDAKNHSKMGTAYTETLKVDFDEVMDYINAWFPEVDGGVDGYKRYLDARRAERSKKSA